MIFDRWHTENGLTHGGTVAASPIPAAWWCASFVSNFMQATHGFAAVHRHDITRHDISRHDIRHTDGA